MTDLIGLLTDPRPLRCRLGFHRGEVMPAHEIPDPIEGRCAFVCHRCFEVIE